MLLSLAAPIGRAYDAKRRARIIAKTHAPESSHVLRAKEAIVKTHHFLLLSTMLTSLLVASEREAHAVTATIPGDFTQLCTAPGGCFKVTNTANGRPALYGSGSIGVQGDGGGLGVWGQGVTGVQGETSISFSYGVAGVNHGTPSTSPGAGVIGDSPANFGVEG